MIDKKLGTTLRSLVRRYGFTEVDRSLRAIRLSEPRLDGAPHSKRADTVQTTKKKKRHAVQAQEYVAKMDHDPEKRPVVSELAKRFEERTFLPTIGDIRNFCQSYGIDEPASKSRASAIPRVFKCMATMSIEELQRILCDGLFSGPSQLGPIADAIRENGRAATHQHSDIPGADHAAVDDPLDLRRTHRR